MRGRANLDLTFEAFEFVGLSGGTSLASVPSYEKKGLCLLQLPFRAIQERTRIKYFVCLWEKRHPRLWVLPLWYIPTIVEKDEVFREDEVALDYLVVHSSRTKRSHTMTRL